MVALGATPCLGAPTHRRSAGTVPTVSTGRPDIDDLHRAVGERVRAGGQIYTKGRRRLVQMLGSVVRPITIPELLEGRDDVPQSSAYRNLSLLEELGVVTRISTGVEHARFELAEDLVGHHHHLICTVCGRVDDFTVPSEVEHTVERALAEVVEANGFVATSHRLDFLGECAACRRSATA